MPLYEYVCPACATTVDVRHGFDESPTLKCEKCGAALKRHFSAAPVLFKGSGFYVTDSREKSGEKAAKPEKPSEKAAEKAAEKPAEKTDAKPEIKSAGEGSSASKTGTTDTAA
ncbi:MAG: hypothetical protein JOY59_10420 [Candidatus Eremiobacteraeota bacterium]|nr:hypothetical protein [Candidatus Eremiobacteraeota bacterium]